MTDYFRQGEGTSAVKLMALVAPATGLVSALIDGFGNLVPTPVTLDPASLQIVGGVLSAPGGVARTAARLQLQWASGGVVANDTLYFAYDAPYAGTINSMTYFSTTGSFTASVRINNVSVTGLSAVSVNSATPATTNATAARTFTVGQRLSVVITGATGSPTGALLSLNATWS